MRCLECEAEIAERAQVCGRCGIWAPVEHHLFVAEGRSADAAYDAAGGPAPTAVRADMGQQLPESAPDPEVDGAVLAGRVETRAFSTTRLRPGYSIDEVDAFLRAIRETFLGIREPSLTPDEIRKKQFSTTRLRPGYDEEEVDAFLDEAESRLAAQVSAPREAPAGEPEPGAADPAADAVQIRCLECGAESAEATEVCDRCGAPIGYQPPAAGQAVAQRARRNGPSRRLLIIVGVTTAMLAVGGLIAGLDHSGSSASSIPSTGQLTIYQLRAGDCLQGSGLGSYGAGVSSFNLLNGGPFTAVPCTQQHIDEVFFAGNAWPGSLAYPGDQAVYDDGIARCLKAFSAYDGIDNSSSAFYAVSSTPDRTTWPGGDRWLVCFGSAPGSVDYSIKNSYR